MSTIKLKPTSYFWSCPIILRGLHSIDLFKFIIKHGSVITVVAFVLF